MLTESCSECELRAYRFDNKLDKNKLKANQSQRGDLIYIKMEFIQIRGFCFATACNVHTTNKAKPNALPFTQDIPF